MATVNGVPAAALPAPCTFRGTPGAPPGQMHRAWLCRRRAAPAAGYGGPAAEIYLGAGRRLPGPPGAQAPITGSHGGPGPRPPSPAGAPSRGPAPPPAHSSLFMRTPSAATTTSAAASAAAVAAAAGRPDWLAAAAPALSHGPRRVRLTGGAAGAALACGQPNRGARGGAGRGRGRRPACVPARPPQPARRRPTAARASSFPPSGGPTEPLRSRHTAAGQGRAPRAGAGFALALGLAPAPPLRGCQSVGRESGLAKGRLLPGSRRPAPPPPCPPPLLPRPPQGPGKGRSVGKGWLSFNRRQRVSRTSVCGARAAERGEGPLQLTPPCPPRRPSPGSPA